MYVSVVTCSDVLVERWTTKGFNPCLIASLCVLSRASVYIRLLFNNLSLAAEVSFFL